MSYLSLLVLWLVIPLAADQSAVAKDGKTVLLKDDGTWEYAQVRGGEVGEEPGFQTPFAIGAAKILGIAVALVVLRYVIRATGKANALAEEGKERERGGG